MNVSRAVGSVVALVRGYSGRDGTNDLLVNALAVAGALLGVVGVYRSVAAIVVLLGVLLCISLQPGWWLQPWRQHQPAGVQVVGRVVVLIAAGVLVARAGRDGAVAWATLSLVAASLLPEAGLASVAGRTFDYVRNLPTYSLRNTPLVRLGWVAALNLAASVLMVIYGAWGGGAVIWLGLVLAAAGFGVEVVLTLDGLRALLRGSRRLTRALREYEPEFVVHWDAPAGTAYQVAMWLPYLEKLQRRCYVLVRTAVNYNEVTAITSLPVVLKRNLEELDQVVVPSLKAAFYVNTATRNCHLIRYTQMKHIQLNHGDSDKVPSFNPVFRMFDRNFVAGQAAIDRFAANGVWVPREMFEIVGRPQVSQVEVARKRIDEADAPTVLYAPTWAGFYADSNYSSLLLGTEMIAALLARGCTMIFRPHPYTYRSARHLRAADAIKSLLAEAAAASGRRHLFGPAAESERSIVDCFNASDALISDVSSVVNDYLYSEKPFAMVTVSAPPEAFAEEFPVSRAAYLIDAHAKKLSNLPVALDELLKADPLREQRRELKRYYLGDFDPERRFLEVARSYL